MPTKNKLPKGDLIKFVDRHGNTRRFAGKLTLKQLLAKGVTHISIVKPDAPFTNDNEYRSTP